MLLSVTIHLLIVLGVLLGAFTPAEKMMARMMPELIDVEALKEQEKKRRSVIFLEVPPDMATEEEPEEADHYSNKNSQAADKQEEKDTNKPKVEGKDEESHRIIDNPAIAKPKPPEPKQEEQPKPREKSKPTVEAKPKPKQAESLNPIQAKPEPKPKPKVEPKPKPKPRRPNSVAEARQLAMLAGDKMKRDGGVRRKASIEGLDAKASPYGEYDARLIAAIQDRWYKIIPDVRDVGRVVITFTLWENGDVSDIEVERSTVSRIHSLKCERAVREPAPYDPWPAEMKEIIGDNRRFVRFTFRYN